MNSVLRLVVTFAAGAAAMYYFDPVAGRRRRAVARDRTAAARHDVEGYARAKCRRAAGRLQGFVSIESRLSAGDEPAPEPGRAGTEPPREGFPQP